MNPHLGDLVLGAVIGMLTTGVTTALTLYPKIADMQRRIASLEEIIRENFETRPRPQLPPPPLSAVSPIAAVPPSLPFPSTPVPR